MTNWDDFGPIAFDALMAAQESDDAMAELNRITSDPAGTLDDHDRQFAICRELKAKALRLRDAALARVNQDTGSHIGRVS